MQKIINDLELNDNMVPEVFNPENDRRCIDCPDMWCLEFYTNNEVWKGFCGVLRINVDGDDVCHLPRQPTTDVLELFSNSDY